MSEIELFFTVFKVIVSTQLLLDISLEVHLVFYWSPYGDWIVYQGIIFPWHLKFKETIFRRSIYLHTNNKLTE